MSQKLKLDGLPAVRKRVEVVEAKLQVLETRIEEWKLAEVEQVADQSKEVGGPPHAAVQGLNKAGVQELLEAGLQHCMHAFKTKLLKCEARISVLESDKEAYAIRISTLEGRRQGLRPVPLPWSNLYLHFHSLSPRYMVWRVRYLCLKILL